MKKENETLAPVNAAAGEIPAYGSDQKIVSAIFMVIVLAVMFIAYAEPVKDGDLWFHMAYARYMVENHTLILDHTIFSWTPTQGDEVYCCWLPELILYALYLKAGLMALFVVKYLFIIVFIALAAFFAARNGVLWHPLTWLTCLMGILMSPAGVPIKPEIFSFVLMSFAVFLWLAIRSPHLQRWWLCYLFPVIVLIWMNTHGGVIFGLTFLGAIFLGELLNGVISPGEALPVHIRKHFFLALFLCAPMTLLTPYGWKYPVQLVQYMVIHPEGKISDFNSVRAYQTIFHFQAIAAHFIDYLAAGGIILASLLWPRIRDRRIDWTVIIVNVIFVALYMRFIRTTYFWAIVLTFTAIHLLPDVQDLLRARHRRLDTYSQYLIVILLLFFSGRAVYDSLNKPLFGFHSSFVNTYEEAEFIKSHYAGLRMGNDYSSGSYLLWALYPGTKVFIDARYFPYKSWYSEYVDFVKGRNVEAFLKKYPCDMWCLSYEFPGIRHFVKSPDWKIAHYGPAACVFVRQGIPIFDEKHQSNIQEGSLSVYQGLRILEFSLSINDIDTAKRVASAMKTEFWCPKGRPLVFQAHVEMGSVLEKNNLVDEAISEFNQALLSDEERPDVYNKLGDLYRKKGDLEKAQAQYLKALELVPDLFPVLLKMSLVHAMKGQYDQSLSYLDRAMHVKPDNPDLYYNRGCVYAKKGESAQSVRWLATAVEKGFKDWSLLKSDPDLQGIRSTQAYQDLVKGH
jgi:tetratricopeptide (TPR) repeat protein